MNFEQKVLNVANTCGLKDAYFYEGSLFFDRGTTTEDEMAEFFLMYPKTVVIFSANEVAVDFTE